MSAVTDAVAPVEVADRVLLVAVTAPPAAPAIPAQRQSDRPGRTTRRRSPLPLVDALRAHVDRQTVALSCPGHKGGAGADPGLRDLLGAGAFTTDVWLDTQTYAAVRHEAEARIAALWGADRAFVLVNGSTSGNQALMLATLGPGDVVVCARDAHVSTHTGLVMTGATAAWVDPEPDASWGVGRGLSPERLAAALDANPSARLAWIVSPSYAGVCSDLPRLVATAHARGVPVVVDEAWGPHLRFGAASGLPVDALTAGADAVTTSTHKMLSSLSQSSVLLVRGARLPVDRVAAAVRMTQTTSPYLPLVASVDACRGQLEDDGPALVAWAVDLARLARTMLGRVPGLRVLSAEDLGLGHAGAADLDGGAAPAYGGLDPCKIVVDVRGRGVDGLTADRHLRDVAGVAVEGADHDRVYLVVGPGDSVASIRRVVLALAGLGSPSAPSGPSGPTGSTRAVPDAGRPWPARPPAVTSERTAYFARHERVPLGESVGRVCAELVTPYPPGIPVVAPGERLTADVVAWLEAAVADGVHVHGPDDATLSRIRVVAEL